MYLTSWSLWAVSPLYLDLPLGLWVSLIFFPNMSCHRAWNIGQSLPMSTLTGNVATTPAFTSHFPFVVMRVRAAVGYFWASPCTQDTRMVFSWEISAGLTSDLWIKVIMFPESNKASTSWLFIVTGQAMAGKFVSPISAAKRLVCWLPEESAGGIGFIWFVTLPGNMTEFPTFVTCSRAAVW